MNERNRRSTASETRLSTGNATRTTSTKTWTAVGAAVIGLIALLVQNFSGSGSPSAARSTTTIGTSSTKATAKQSSSGQSSSGQSSSGQSSSKQSSSGQSNRNNPALRAIGFRTPQKLADHYGKHGREFGNISKARYLSMAQDLRDAPLSKTVIETTQRDGSISRFNRSTGAFLAFDPDLTIRTFFKPNDGEDYFWRAAKLSH